MPGPQSLAERAHNANYLQHRVSGDMPQGLGKHVIIQNLYGTNAKRLDFMDSMKPQQLRLQRAIVEKNWSAVESIVATVAFIICTSGAFRRFQVATAINMTREIMEFDCLYTKKIADADVNAVLSQAFASASLDPMLKAIRKCYKHA